MKKIIKLTVIFVLTYMTFSIGLMLTSYFGASGTELIALMVLFPIGLFLLGWLMYATFYAIRYVIKSRPTGKMLVVTYIFITLLLAFLSLRALTFYYETSGQADDDSYRKSTISKTEALSLINDCKIEEYDYAGGFQSTPIMRGFDYHTYHLNFEDLGDIEKALRQAATTTCKQIKAPIGSGFRYEDIDTETTRSLLEKCEVKYFVYTDGVSEDIKKRTSMSGKALVSLDIYGRYNTLFIPEQYKDPLNSSLWYHANNCKA